MPLPAHGRNPMWPNDIIRGYEQVMLLRFAGPLRHCGGGKISKSSVRAAMIELYQFGSFGLPNSGNGIRTDCDL